MVNVANQKIQRNPQIQFEWCDLMNDDHLQVIEQFLKKQNRVKFDVIFCFSVSMWIHLNHGEEGLSRLFKNVQKYCDQLFLLEPQVSQKF